LYQGTAMNNYIEQIDLQDRIITTQKETLEIAQKYIATLKCQIETQERIIKIMEMTPKVNYIQGAI
jgi:hypothetical protein